MIKKMHLILHFYQKNVSCFMQWTEKRLNGDMLLLNPGRLSR